MMITDDILRKLNSNDYKIALQNLKNVINEKDLCNEDILKILSLNNKLIINDFFNLQRKFTKSNLSVIEVFINNNLSHKDKLFVSDLIEIATDFNLIIDYNTCVKLLKKYKNDNHYVLMSTMEYLFFNLKMNYLSEIINYFSDIYKNKEIDISARLKSIFYIYRITQKEKYLTHLKQFVGIDSYNKEIIKNLLKLDPNNKNNFEGYSKVFAICK